MKEKPITVLADDGSSLGLVCKDGDEIMLMDATGKEVCKVNGGMTIKGCKEILALHKLDAERKSMAIE